MAVTYDEFGNPVEVNTTTTTTGANEPDYTVDDSVTSGQAYDGKPPILKAGTYDENGNPYNPFENSEEASGSSDPSQNRLDNAGLKKGGGAASTRGLQAGSSPPRVTFAPGETDWRVKISLADHAFYMYKDPAHAGIMTPLIHTDGVIFPYTPQISVSHVARYGSQNLTHSNYTNYFYEGSEVQAITISGDFTVQNSREGAYLLACIYFFRAATKMFFGNYDLAGNPPPMVFLNGYGTHYFPNVPCVVTNFTHQLPQDVDYMEVPTNGATPMIQRDGRPIPFPTTRVPTNSNISVTLQPIYSRANLYDNFSLEDFSAGFLIKGSGGYI